MGVPKVLWIVGALAGGLAIGLALGLTGCSSAEEMHAPPTAAPSTDIPPRAASATAPAVDASTWDVYHDIRAAYDHRFHASWACLRAPSSCDRSYVLPGSAAAGHLEVTLAELIARDRFIGPEPVGYHQVEQIDVKPDGTAVVTACWWSTAVLYGAPIRPDEPPGPTNPHTVVSSTPEGGRQRDLLVRTAHGWALARVDALDTGSSVDPCGGES